jgi:hypothetical protein
MSLELLEAVSRGTMTPDEAHGRIFGWIEGTVTDIDTNLKQVKARIGKQADQDSTDWLIPVGMGSMESLPEVGDKIGVISQDGDIHRGAYFYFPQSTTNGRPAQHVILGENLIGMFNFLIDQFNQLKSDFNNHTHQVPYTWTGAPGSNTATAGAPTASTALSGNKGNASDGSTVPNKTSSQTVLSKRSLVR